MKKLFSVILAIIIGLSSFVSSNLVFADGGEGDNCVPTAILGGGEVCDTSGSSIFGLLLTIIDIMTIGVGILGVVGISITGIQYLTAGGNEEKTRKAKHRMFEIIIGLALYAVFFLLMQWIIPSFELPEGQL